MSAQSIERVTGVTRQAYLHDVVPRGRPLIITNDPSLRKAAATWSFDYLASRHPHHTVPVEHYPTGRRDGPWTYVEMEIPRYIELMREHPEERGRYYLAEKHLAEIFPETADELELPAILAGERAMKRMVFVGVDTFSAAHYHRAPTEAVLTQITGTKRITLYSASEHSLLRPNGWYTARANFSMFAAEGEAETSGATPYECTLQPGEMLFIPQGWFHVVHGVAETVSVTNFYPGSWRHAHPRVATRDLLSLAEKQLVLYPLLRLARRTGQTRALLRLGALLGILPKAELDVWASRYEGKH